MMSVHSAASAGGASQYFARDNYYQKDEGWRNSEWYGRGAEALHLSGQVRAEDFHETLHGRDPESGAQLVQVGPGGEHRPGVDCTYSAPKSVSLAGLVEGDERVIEAHKAAVRDALDWMQEHCSQYRLTRGGEVTFEKADNLTAAVFHHDTSRAGDPQLHSHTFVHNMVKTEAGWRALSNEEIYNEKMTAGAIYRASLASRLQELGYQIDRTHADGRFEIAGYSRDQVEQFSQRRAEIEERLKAAGFSSARASEVAALDTRREKQHFDRDELSRTWTDRAREARIDGSVTRTARESGPAHVTDGDRERAAEEAVRFAGDHLGERAAAWTDRALTKHAVQHVIGRGGDHRDVEAAAERMIERGELIRTESGRMTTPEAVLREGETIETMRRGMETQTPLMSHDKAREMIARRNAEREADGQKPYTPGQADAIRGLVTSRDRVTAVEGRAGTGKTTMLKAVAEEYRAGGYSVRGIAPSAAAARVLEDEAGIKSQTLAKHLIDGAGRPGREPGREDEGVRWNPTRAWDGIARELRGRGAPETVIDKARHTFWKREAERQGKGRLERQAAGVTQIQTTYNRILQDIRDRAEAREAAKPQAWVLDEAGMVGTKDFRDLLRQAEAQGARVVMVGDTRQLRAVEAGQPFSQLQAGGMQTVKMEDIVRQRDSELRQAVDLAARGKAVESFNKLHEAGRVTEIPDREARIQAIAKDYLSRPPELRNQTQVMTGTNENRKAINEAIRDGLKQEGTLRGRGADTEVLVKKDMTKAQMRQAEHYQAGNTIRFNRDYERLSVQKGEYARVEKADPNTNRLTVRTVSGREVSYDPARFQKVEVYRREERDLTAGDKIKFTRNDYTQDRRNGETATVRSVDPEKREGEIVTDRGKVQTIDLDREKHWEHGYARTVHDMQGGTVREAIYDLDSRSQTSGPEAHYVAASRETHDVRIYTDDAERAREAIRGGGGEPNALDVARQVEQEREKGAEARALELAQGGGGDKGGKSVDGGDHAKDQGRDIEIGGR